MAEIILVPDAFRQSGRTEHICQHMSPPVMMKQGSVHTESRMANHSVPAYPSSKALHHKLPPTDQSNIRARHARSMFAITMKRLL
jgi:hypothetical protein